MIFELLLILPIYIGIFVIFYRFKHVIKAMSEIEMFSEIIESSEINKREFLMDRVKSGEQISNLKTPWTEERLEKASDKVIEKLYDKYQNPPPVKINKREALELGGPVCPTVIEMYAEGLGTLVDQMPLIKDRYVINVEKLKTNILANKLFCDSLAIKIGSRMIEQMGENSAMRVSVSLATMTWDAVEKRERKSSQVSDNSGNKQDE